MSRQESATRQVSIESASSYDTPPTVVPTASGDAITREIEGIAVTTIAEGPSSPRAARSEKLLPHAPRPMNRDHSSSRTGAHRDAALRDAQDTEMSGLGDLRDLRDARDVTEPRDRDILEHRSRKDSRARREEGQRMPPQDTVARPPRAHADYDSRDRAPMPGPRQPSWIPNLFGTRDTAQAEIAQLRRLLHDADARENELRTRLTETERRLVVVTRDLEESRSFVAKEDSDAKELIDAFNDTNEAVDDLAYLISEAFAKDDLAVKLTNDAVHKATSSDAAVHDLFISVLRVLRIQDGSLEDVITWMIACILHNLLYVEVFRPWSPGLEKSKSDIIKQLYQCVCKREPQDRSARWRSMTYLDCHPGRNDTALVSSVTESFFRILSASLLPLLPPSSTFDFSTLPPAFSNRVSKVVLDAIHFQDKAKGTYLSFDYEVYLLHHHHPYDRSHCELADKPQRWAFTTHHSEGVRPGDQKDVVLAGTSLGLRAVKGSVDSQGVVSRPAKIVVRGKALVGRCTFLAPSTASTGDNPPPNHE